MSDRRAPLAFTLVELAVAMAIASIIALAALSTFSMVARYRVRMQLMTAVDDTAKVITSYLVRETQRMGGASLRPYQAFGVRNCDPGSAHHNEDFTCITSDAITLAFFDETAVPTSCAVEAFSGSADTDLVIKFSKVPDPREGATDPVCCPLLHYDADHHFAVREPGDAANSHFIVTHDGMHMGITLGTVSGVCEWSAFRSHQSKAFVSAGLSEADYDPAEDQNNMDNTAAVPAELAPNAVRGTTAVPVRLSTLFVGCPAQPNAPPVLDCPNAARGLYLFSDADGAADPTHMTYTASADPTQKQDVYKLLAPGILDLRVRLGLDRDRSGFLGNPTDEYDADANAREWLPFEALAQLPDRFQMDSLLMLQISLVSGGSVHDPTFKNAAVAIGNEAKIFSEPGMYFTSSYTRMAMRGMALYR